LMMATADSGSGNVFASPRRALRNN